MEMKKQYISDLNAGNRMDSNIIPLKPGKNAAITPGSHGSKALNLLKISNHFLVSPGCAVGSSYFQRAYKSLKKIRPRDVAKDPSVLNILEPEFIHGVVTALEEAKISSGPLIVRSSYDLEDGKDSSFSGQFISIRDVDFSPANAVDLKKAILAVWLSAFDRTLLHYYQKHKIAAKGGMGLIIQKQLSPDWFGVTFSLDPATFSKKHMVMEYKKKGFDAHLEGKNNANICWLEKAKKDRAGYSIAKERIFDHEEILPDADLLRIAQWVKKIEKIYGFPVDVEWGLQRARSNGKKVDHWYVFQVREITGKSHPSA